MTIRPTTYADLAQFTRCGIIYTRDNSPRMAYQCLGTAIVKD